MERAIVVFGAVLLAAAVALLRPTADAPAAQRDGAMSFARGVVETSVAPRAATNDGGGYVTACDGGRLHLNAQEMLTLRLHNQTRAQHGLGQLCVHPTLTAAARGHSREMIDKDYMSHNSFDGEDAGARLSRSGYGWRAWGENVAWGSGPYTAPESRFGVWMNSPSHRANILDGGFHEVGVGTATGAFAGYENATAYTVDFGATAGPPAAPGMPYPPPPPQE